MNSKKSTDYKSAKNEKNVLNIIRKDGVIHSNIYHIEKEAAKRGMTKKECHSILLKLLHSGDIYEPGRCVCLVSKEFKKK